MIARIIFFILGIILLFFYPWITIVLGGILFSVLFRSPLETLVWGLFFELLSGSPAGTVILPLTAAITFQTMAQERFFESTSLLSRISLYIFSILCFIGIRAFFLIAVFGLTLPTNISFLTLL